MLSGLARLPCAARNCCFVDFPPFDFFFFFCYVKLRCQTVIYLFLHLKSLPGQHWTDANAANTIVLFISVSFKNLRLFLVFFVTAVCKMSPVPTRK